MLPFEPPLLTFLNRVKLMINECHPNVGVMYDKHCKGMVDRILHEHQSSSANFEMVYFSHNIKVGIQFEDGLQIEILKHTTRLHGMKKSVWIVLEIVNPRTKVPQKSYGIHPVYFISDHKDYFDIEGNPITLTQAATLAYGFFYQSHAAIRLVGG